MRRALTTLFFLLPPSSLKNRLLNRLGHRLHPTAVVGICLVRRVDLFELGEGALIHHFNFFRDMAKVEMGRSSRIMLFNQIHGDSGYQGAGSGSETLRTLRMGEQSHIISHHYLDCGGGVLMADNSWLTGIRSTLLSHAFDPLDGRVLLDPVVLEKGAVVATSCTMLPGSALGEGALLAAGSSLWTGQQAAAAHLHGGVPARRLSPITIAPEGYQRARYDG